MKIATDILGELQILMDNDFNLQCQSLFELSGF